MNSAGWGSSGTGERAAAGERAAHHLLPQGRPGEPHARSPEGGHSNSGVATNV